MLIFWLTFFKNYLLRINSYKSIEHIIIIYKTDNNCNEYKHDPLFVTALYCL